jgi:hypothetical protein
MASSRLQGEAVAEQGRSRVVDHVVPVRHAKHRLSERAGTLCQDRYVI